MSPRRDAVLAALLAILLFVLRLAWNAFVILLVTALKFAWGVTFGLFARSPGQLRYADLLWLKHNR